MSNSKGFSNKAELKQSVRVDPSVILRSRVLTLTQHELEQTIEAELMDNPALERLESEQEPVTDEQVLKTIAPGELRFKREDSEFQRCQSPEEPEVVWTELAATSNSLHDHVRAQILVTIEPRLKTVANYLVDSLNERGYLETSTEELALALNASIEDVEIARAELRKCEPPGVGASGVVDCLLLQLRDASTFEELLAREILTHYLDDLVARRTSRISRRYKVLPNVVEATFASIQELNPNPGEGFSSSPSSLMVSHSVAVYPDLVLRRTEQGWEIEPRGGDPSLLKVNSTYKSRLASLKKDRHADEDERAHLQEYASRAEQFIQSLKDRRRTLRQIGAYLIEKQGSFISTGQYEFLVSLTRNQLAQEIGVHESTVSRATMGKFVQLANNEVVPFELFFKPALRIQKMIEEILEHENPNSPLSDEQIAQLLAKKGIEVARRTVNKYRDKTRMLNSRARKSA